MPADNSQLTRRVASYIRYRPRYPNVILEVLNRDCLLSEKHVVADIGCGPGVLAELFLDNGNRVIGVEPDADMLNGAVYALQDYSRFTCVPGTAESTTLPDQSVDFICAGQAFHWFEPTQTRLEFSRILRPGGWVVLIWNLQRKEGSPFLRELSAFWKNDRYWNSDRALNYGSEAWQKGSVEEDILQPFFGPGSFQDLWFENPLLCDLEGLKGRIFSTLPGLMQHEPGYEEMLEALKGLYESHQENGVVVIEHDTRLVYGQLD